MCRPETIEEAQDRWRPEILPGVVPYYEHDSSEHPDAIRISFGDGSTAIYDLRVEQPHPQCRKAIDLIRIMNESTYSGYYPRHTKK